MIRSYFTVALRNIFRNKVFSAINIFGLSIGLAACLLIFQFVSFQLSYDEFHTKIDRIYRVTNDRFQHGKLIQHGTITYPTIGPTMAKDYPEIESYTRLMPDGDLNVRVEDRSYRGEESIFADEHFLTIFDFALLAGIRETALKEPHTMVLTESTALKYFPDLSNASDAVNKTLLRGLDNQPWRITGILKDIPENSHLHFDALISYCSLYEEEKDADISWVWSDMRVYLLLRPGTDAAALESKFPEFSERYFQGDKVSGSIEKFSLQPLRKAHLYSDYEYDVADVASGKAVWGMLIVAVFILVIAWINYINLTTSRAMERAKEVGLRKVMGAMRDQLMKQFIFESIIISLAALAISFLIILFLQSSFNEIISSNLSLWRLFASMSTGTIAILVLVMLGGIFLSGFYPAFVLSSYQPVTVLKGKFQRSSSGNVLRRSLVVFQFTASAILITGTLIVSRQLKFMNEADLGMNISNVIAISSPELTEWDSTFVNRIENYKQELMEVNGVISAGTSGRLPGSRLGRSFGIKLADQPADQKVMMSHVGIDYTFFKTFDVKILAGRPFSFMDHKVDFEQLNTVILNESAVKLLGLKSNEDAVGRELHWGQRNGSNPNIQYGARSWTIIGVVNDYHQESLKKPKEPIIFRPTYATYSQTMVKFESGKSTQVLAEVEKIYKKFFPGNSFNYSFLEDAYRSQYSDDNRFGKVIGIFTFLGIVIACLGLIGLSSYTAVQRTKEIGIRKVLGASTVSIVSLLSVDFMRLVVLSTLLGLPVAWYAMNGWLSGYAYRITPGVLAFATPVVLILIIAGLTISGQVLKTAMTDPAKTLKHD